jgi:hypothetical protein
MTRGDSDLLKLDMQALQSFQMRYLLFVSGRKSNSNKTNPFL